MAFREMAGRRQGPGTGEQKLHALLRRSGLREQAERTREPACSTFGRKP
jgi:hypothetical protein